MIVEAVLLGALFLCLLYLWLETQRKYSYWRKKGVPGPKPLPLVGSLDLLGRPFSSLYRHLYESYRSDPYVGFFELAKPKLLLRDPKIIQQVLIKDFGSFMDRGPEADESIIETDSGLFTLRGQRWKAVRNKLTPTFTSGRLRLMVPLMCDWGQSVVRSADSEVDVEAREMAFSFTTGVIASTAFGLDPSSVGRPDSKFREMAMKALEFNITRLIKVVTILNCRWLARLLKWSFTPREVANFFSAVIRETMDERRRSGVVRNDFAQLLLQLKDKGFVEWTPPEPDDDYLQPQQAAQSETFEMTDVLLISQAFSFLSAGSEPVANTITYALFELAKNPEVQEKAKAEVEAVLATHRNLSYEALKQMEYLEKCIQETLRKYPVVQQLLRECSRDYQLPDGGPLIEAGTGLIIPIAGIQNDPQFYPEPASFMPERFFNQPEKGTYLPFGEGPRMCIAMRFAQMEVKVFLACLLHNYKVLPSPKTKDIQMNKWSFFTSPTNKIYLTFRKTHLDNCTFCLNKISTTQ